MIWPRSHSCRILTCLEPALLLNLVSFKFLINFSLLFPALSSGTFIDANPCLGFQGLQEPSLLIWFKFFKKGSKVSKHTEYALWVKTALRWRYLDVLPWKCHKHWFGIRIFGHIVEISIERRQVEIFFKRIQNNLSYIHPWLVQQIRPLKNLFFIT